MFTSNTDDWLLILNAVAPVVYLCLSLIIFARLAYSIDTIPMDSPMRPLTASPKPGKIAEDQKQTYLIVLKSTNNGEAATAMPAREEIIRINQRGIESFKTELKAWEMANNLPGQQSPLQIVGEMPALNMLVVLCSAETKEKLEKLEAIAEIRINRGGLAPI